MTICMVFFLFCHVLCHRGVQLILAYSWARPAVLGAGKGREGMFLFLLFLHCHSFSFLPCPSLSSRLLSLLSLFSPAFSGDDTKWPTRVDISLNPSTIKSLRKIRKTPFFYAFIRQNIVELSQNKKKSKIQKLLLFFIHLFHKILGVKFNSIEPDFTLLLQGSS